MSPFVVRVEASVPQWRLLYRAHLMRYACIQPLISDRKTTYACAAAAEPGVLVQRQRLNAAHAIMWCRSGAVMVMFDRLGEDDGHPDVHLARSEEGEEHQLLVLPQGTHFSIVSLNMIDGRHAYAPASVIVAFYTPPEHRPDELRVVKMPDLDLRLRVLERIEQLRNATVEPIH